MQQESYFLFFSLSSSSIYLDPHMLLRRFSEGTGLINKYKASIKGGFNVKMSHKRFFLSALREKLDRRMIKVREIRSSSECFESPKMHFF